MSTMGVRAGYALVDALEDHLGWLLTHGYSHATVRVRRFELRNLSRFLAELGIFDVGEVSFSALESYQRNQYHHRKADGAPLSFRTQSHRLVAVKLLFSWLVRQGQLGFDPAAAIELPKVERRLPEATLSAEEAEAVLAGPDVTTALGLRDRAVLEVFYSSALRRSELIGLRLSDIDGGPGNGVCPPGKRRQGPLRPHRRAGSGLGAPLCARGKAALGQVPRRWCAVPVRNRRGAVSRVADADGACLRESRRTGEKGQLPPLPPFGRHIDARRWGRRALRRRVPRPREPRVHQDLHPGLGRKAPRRAPGHPPGRESGGAVS